MRWQEVCQHCQALSEAISLISVDDVTPSLTPSSPLSPSAAGGFALDASHAIYGTVDDPTLTLQRDRASASDIQGSTPLLYGNAAAIAAAAGGGLGTVQEGNTYGSPTATTAGRAADEYDTSVGTGEEKKKCIVM